MIVASPGLLFSTREYPADTQHTDNVASTSMQRHDVASTLIPRCKNMMCSLGVDKVTT